jgi:enediyne polyketide synthase
LFTYNLDVVDANGCVSERWEGLQLQSVADQPIRGPWVESLLGPYIERRIEELIPGASISVALVRSSETDRRERSNRAIQMALDEKVEILRRPDGKPEVDGGRFVSASHTGGLTLAIAGSASLACDIEQVMERSVSEWQDLLGKNRLALASLVAKKLKEDMSLAATRIWTAAECLTKIGTMPDAALCLDSSIGTGWVLFSSGRLKVASCAIQISGDAEKLVLSIVTQTVPGRS